ncbi:MAG: Holliday junction resolvase RuvX [Candidatus Cloacimonadales bacterium]|nr:Holliday junction resolvase RuvX [Candidatus Cloacimonadales bacterium]
MSLHRLMCIDYGEVRIGIAVSDPLQIISSPFSVISNHAETVFKELKNIIKTENVGKIILGLPLNLEGEDTDKTRQVRKFAELLETEISIPLEFWDESYSTVEANQALKQMGYDSKKSRTVVDKVAASIILQDYLDQNK